MSHEIDYRQSLDTMFEPSAALKIEAAMALEAADDLFGQVRDYGATSGDYL